LYCADGDTPTEYTLRRSCAQTLDCLAVGLGDELLQYVMPTIEMYLQTKEWQLREAAVLALGAIADGCMAGLRQLAPHLIALLLEKARDSQPNVRCNACWAVGRFAAFVVQDVAEMNGAAAAAGYTMLQVVSALTERAFVCPLPCCCILIHAFMLFPPPSFRLFGRYAAFLVVSQHC
jgi:hypothetical protein